MSERERWMPSAVRIQGAMAGGWPSVEREIRAAVEKALAEQREAIALDVDLAKMCAERLAEELRVLRLIIQSDKVQRRREVIEARICGIQAVAEIIPTGLHSYSIAKRWIAALRAELAALDKEGEHE